MNDPLLTLVVDVAEDLEIAENRELDRFLEQSFLPLAIGDLPMAHVRDELDLIDAPFAHISLNKDL